MPSASRLLAPDSRLSWLAAVVALLSRPQLDATRRQETQLDAHLQLPHWLLRHAPRTPLQNFSVLSTRPQLESAGREHPRHLVWPLPPLTLPLADLPWHPPHELLPHQLLIHQMPKLTASSPTSDFALLVPGLSTPQRLPLPICEPPPPWPEQMQSHRPCETTIDSLHPRRSTIPGVGQLPSSAPKPSSDCDPPTLLPPMSRAVPILVFLFLWRELHDVPAATSEDRKPYAQNQLLCLRPWLRPIQPW